MDRLRIMSYLGIVTGVWDLLCHLKDEMTFLSGLSCEVNIVKVLYVVTRYSPFLIQSGCIFFASTVQKYIPHPPPHICQYWLLFSVSSCQWMASLLIINLMLRAYALYNRSLYVIFTLMFLLVCKVLVVLLVWKGAIQNPQQRFSPSCDPLFRQSLNTVLYSITEFLTTGVPVYLILRRSSKLSSIIREGAIETKRLVEAIRRGGIITWSAIVFLAIIENAVSVYRKDSGSETQQVFFPLFITLAQCGGCRLILQLRKPNFTPEAQASQESGSSGISPDFELNTYDSTWDARTLLD